LRASVTALARAASIDAQQQREKKHTEDAAEALWRSPARCLWAMRLARIYESAPLACPQCGADMQIIAFVTASISEHRIPTHIDEGGLNGYLTSVPFDSRFFDPQVKCRTFPVLDDGGRGGMNGQELA
jgi:hypothetical protein